MISARRDLSRSPPRRALRRLRRWRGHSIEEIGLAPDLEEAVRPAFGGDVQAKISTSQSYNGCAMRRLDLHQQFLLTRKQSLAPCGFHVIEMLGWTLATHPNLTSCTLVNGKEPIGWIIGDAINAPAILASQIDVAGQTVESLIDRLAGRYAIIVVGGPSLRLYTDAGATLAVVYDPTEQFVGSTTTILQRAAQRSFSAPGPTDFPANQPNQFWPCGLTADASIRRLLPNHYLDLANWQTVRYWPRANDLDTSYHLKRQVRDIASTLCSTLEALVAKYRALYVPLTAGSDSRAIAAAVMACGYAKQTTFVTFDYCEASSMAAADVEGAQRIARQCEVPHVIIPVPLAPSDDRVDYQWRTGHAGSSGKARDFLACRDNLDPSHVWLPGFGAEVGRGFYWKNMDMSIGKRRTTDASDLLHCLGLPEREDFTTAASEWLNGQPSLTLFELLDIAYMELRLGCWASPHLYGMAPFRSIVAPLSSRRIFKAMLSLPAPYRRSGQITADVARYLSPQIAAVADGRRSLAMRFPLLWSYACAARLQMGP